MSEKTQKISLPKDIAFYKLCLAFPILFTAFVFSMWAFGFTSIGIVTIIPWGLVSIILSAYLFPFCYISPKSLRQLKKSGKKLKLKHAVSQNSGQENSDQKYIALQQSLILSLQKDVNSLIQQDKKLKLQFKLELIIQCLIMVGAIASILSSNTLFLAIPFFALALCNFLPIFYGVFANRMKGLIFGALSVAAPLAGGLFFAQSSLALPLVLGSPLMAIITLAAFLILALKKSIFNHSKLGEVKPDKGLTSSMDSSIMVSLTRIASTIFRLSNIAELKQKEQEGFINDIKKIEVFKLCYCFSTEKTKSGWHRNKFYIIEEQANKLVEKDIIFYGFSNNLFG